MKKSNIGTSPKGSKVKSATPLSVPVKDSHVRTSDVNRAEKSSGIVLTAAIIVAVLAVNVLLYVLASVFGLYLRPREKDITVLSGATDALFAEAIETNKKVKITFFYSFNIQSDVSEHATGRYVHRTVKNFEERYPGLITVDYVNLVTRQSELEGGRVSIEKYQNTDTPLSRFSVAFECENRIKVVTDTVSKSAYADFYTLDSEEGAASSYDGEQFVASMICRVIRDSDKKAYFTKSHSETLDPAFARLLTLAGYDYDVNGIELRKNTVPEDCDLLIISNPKTDFESGAVTSEIGKLEDYIRKGGNLMVMLDPFTKKLNTLEGLLEKYGISVSRSTLSDGRVVSDVVREDGVFGAGGSAVGTTDGYTFAATFAGGDGIGGAIADKVKDISNASVIVRTAGALNLNGELGAKAILTSSKTSHCEMDGEITRDGGSFPIAAVSRRAAEIGSGESTVFVISGIYSTATANLTSNGYANRDFYYALLENAFGAENMPYGFKMVLISDTVAIEGLTMGMAKLYLTVSMIVPVSLAVIGTVIVIRRKNR